MSIPARQPVLFVYTQHPSFCWSETNNTYSTSHFTSKYGQRFQHRKVWIFHQHKCMYKVRVQSSPLSKWGAEVWCPCRSGTLDGVSVNTLPNLYSRQKLRENSHWTSFVNYHILIIHNWSGYGYINFHSNWQFFERCLAYEMNCCTQYFISEKYAYFCDILIKIKLHSQNVQPKNLFGCSDPGGWWRGLDCANAKEALFLIAASRWSIQGWVSSLPET